MSVNQIVYVPFARFLLRTPYYPVEYLRDALSGLQDPAIQLLPVWKEPAFREAIYLSSPDLYDEISQINTHEDLLARPAKKQKKIINATLKYLKRMSGRCTPFGLFAGCTVGKIGDELHLPVSAAQHYTRHTRLDMDFLVAFSHRLLNDPVIRSQVKYYTNNSIYQTGKHARYITYRYGQHQRLHNIARINCDEFLWYLAASCRSGLYYQELVALIADDEVSEADATAFVNELIDEQVLISELEPPITGQEPLQYLLALLRPLNGAAQYVQLLEEIAHLLQQVDEAPIGTTVDLYKMIEEKIGQLGIPFNRKYIFQADLYKPAEALSFPRQWCDELTDALRVLNAFAFDPARDALSIFREAYFNRYETREMPLSLVLDNETGIGYADHSGAKGDISPLTDTLFFGNPQPRQQLAAEIPWDDGNSLILSKYLSCLRDNEYTITITDADIQFLDKGWDGLPPTISVACEVIRTEEDEPALYLKYASGPSASRLLGRFCFLHEDIHHYVQEITTAEAASSPDVIFAEIVHLPESRVGNILLRPVLRDYEIPYLGRSGADPAHQILPDDLMVSVRSNRVVLRSRSLNKEVRPCMSTAHNHTFKTLPLYHFLCDLTMQDHKGGFSFRWGHLQTQFNFFPRIVYRNIIISKARWICTASVIRNMLTREDPAELMKYIEEWRFKNMVPRYVNLADGDNTLFIDLKNKASVAVMIAAIRSRVSFLLEESFFDYTPTFSQGAAANYANEVILSFQQKKETK